MASIIEVVIYHIKPDYIDSYQQLDLLRFRSLVENLKGFRCYHTYQSCNQSTYHLDLVEWDSIEDAVVAAQSVQKMQQSPQFKDYLEAFDKVEVFHHFKSIK